MVERRPSTVDKQQEKADLSLSFQSSVLARDRIKERSSTRGGTGRLTTYPPSGMLKDVPLLAKMVEQEFSPSGNDDAQGGPHIV
jgi:hypothetical protein